MYKLYVTLLSCCLFFSFSYSQFQPDDGPWYASRVRDIAVGYSGGYSTIYAVNLSENGTTRTLIKSTDGGATWMHINAITDPICVATRFDNPNIVFASQMGVGIRKSTNGGATWTTVQAGLIPNRITKRDLSSQPDTSSSRNARNNTSLNKNSRENQVLFCNFRALLMYFLCNLRTHNGHIN